ncbi:hypothetical protein PRZ48_004706 [Zasmidium cellare]|uniref:Uncharacterized protein n=1 Tax=Zasmidium cellare TaxID=395010 RepID=A0ABR0EQA6_ZASCE|nr:hypothetical protein PRZ48_004706 [Zasmidium cellare]
MAPTTRSAASKPPSVAKAVATAPTAPATKKKATPKKKAATKVGAVKKQPTKKVTKKTAKKTKKQASPVQSPRSPIKFANADADDLDNVPNEAELREFLSELIVPDGISPRDLVDLIDEHWGPGIFKTEAFDHVLSKVVYLARVHEWDPSSVRVYLEADSFKGTSPANRPHEHPTEGYLRGLIGPEGIDAGDLIEHFWNAATLNQDHFVEILGNVAYLRVDEESVRLYLKEDAPEAQTPLSPSFVHSYVREYIEGRENIEKGLKEGYEAGFLRGAADQLFANELAQLPTETNLRRAIGPDGTTLHKLGKQFKKYREQAPGLFWRNFQKVARIDRTNSPSNVQLKEDVASHRSPNAAQHEAVEYVKALNAIKETERRKATPRKGLFGDTHSGLFGSTANYLPVEGEIRGAIGFSGIALSDLVSHFRDAVRGQNKALFLLHLTTVAYVDTTKRPVCVYLKDSPPSDLDPRALATYPSPAHSEYLNDVRDAFLEAVDDVSTPIGNDQPAATPTRPAFGGEFTGYFPSRYEIQEFIGPNGTSHADLAWKFRERIEGNENLFWTIVWQVAAIDKTKHPWHIYLTGDNDVLEDDDDPGDGIYNLPWDFVEGGAGPSTTSKKKGKKNRKRSGKAKDKARAQRSRQKRAALLQLGRHGVPGQTMDEAVRIMNGPEYGPSGPVFNPSGSRAFPFTPDGYTGDVDTPVNGPPAYTPASTTVGSIQASKGKGKVVSPWKTYPAYTPASTTVGSIQASKGKGKVFSPSKTSPAFTPNTPTTPTRSPKGKGKGTLSSYSAPRYSPIYRPITPTKVAPPTKATSPIYRPTSPFYKPTSPTKATLPTKTTSPTKATSPNKVTSPTQDLRREATRLAERHRTILTEVREMRYFIENFKVELEARYEDEFDRIDREMMEEEERKGVSPTKDLRRETARLAERRRMILNEVREMGAFIENFKVELEARYEDEFDRIDREMMEEEERKGMVRFAE